MESFTSVITLTITSYYMTKKNILTQITAIKDKYKDSKDPLANHCTFAEFLALKSQMDVDFWMTRGFRYKYLRTIIDLRTDKVILSDRNLKPIKISELADLIIKHIENKHETHKNSR